RAPPGWGQINLVRQRSQNTLLRRGPKKCVQTGRWIACDESGNDGEQLLNGRYLVYASVAVDDAQAADIVRELRRDAGIQQGAELKFRAFSGRWANRREVLRRLWGHGGALEGRCAAYVVDKEYAAVAKVVDLLLEEYAWAQGRDLYRDGEGRRIARVLALQGRRALKQEGFHQLLKAFVGYASQRAVKNDEAAATAAFYNRVEAAWASSTRREVTNILFRLRATRPQGDVLHVDSGPFPLLEMLVPCVAATARHWAKCLGEPVSLLTDEQKTLTDERLDRLAQVLGYTSGATPSSRIGGISLHQLLRGSSADHPSLQLADLLAGATAAVAARHTGVDSPTANDLCSTVMPLVNDESLLPYDTASALAEPGAAPH
ncbi:DUF3800 domain-containing protein, partial [Streptomyces alboflavus]|uniref:DUF3800 domain-containing protein n=1 Tax=Streptomyces alboflavus TaxID=67267 RepID=UPI003691F9FA